MKLIVTGGHSPGEFNVRVNGTDIERNFSKGCMAYDVAHQIAAFLEETTEPVEPEASGVETQPGEQLAAAPVDGEAPAPAADPEVVADVPARIRKGAKKADA